jgi:MFS family permease
LLGVGVAGFLFVPTARVWGKRHCYILGTILIIVSSAWGGASGTNYKSLLWARIIQGVGLAPFEALVNASVGDLYFVHERGLRMAVSNMALFGGAFFTPILVGKIAHTLGWAWSFYLIAIFMGTLLPFMVLFVPETAYTRPEMYNTDIVAVGTAHGASIDENPAHQASQAEGFFAPQKSRALPAKATFIQGLALFNGRKTDESLLKLILRPLPLFLHPGILWACLIQGALIGWTVLIGVVLAAVFLGPPLWFDEVKTGYMYAGPFVGAILGFILSGLISDWSTKLMIRRNNGVYEPEFRIVLVLAQLVFGSAGLYGFGYVSENVHGAFLPAFFFALEVMGMVLGAVASALYIVDAHREIAVEAFTCLLIFKNVFSFGLTFGAYGWLTSYGPSKIFLIIASVQVAICLLSIPMCKFMAHACYGISRLC